MENRFKTSDIKLHKDSQSVYEATHKYQGTLYESEFFETRAEARREAVNVLMEMKSDEYDEPDDEVKFVGSGLDRNTPSDRVHFFIV